VGFADHARALRSLEAYKMRRLYSRRRVCTNEMNRQRAALYIKAVHQDIPFEGSPGRVEVVYLLRPGDQVIRTFPANS
jgi:hypothetical protein